MVIIVLRKKNIEYILQRFKNLLIYNCYDMLIAEQEYNRRETILFANFYSRRSLCYCLNSQSW